MTSRGLLVGICSVAVAAILSPSPTWAGAGDGIELTVEEGPGPGEVLLDWIGGTPPYEVFRSAVAAQIHAGAPLGSTDQFQWSDTPPAISSIWFYRVVRQEPFPLFTEYVEGSGSNKALEIYNPRSTTFALSTCEVRIYFNGNPAPLTTIDLDDDIGPGGTWVVCDDSASAPLAAVCDVLSGETFFNGDDAVELWCPLGTTDVIGQIGVDPGSEWAGGGVSTLNRTMRRKCSVGGGDPDGSDSFDPSAEWDGAPQDDFSDLGIRNCP